MQIKIFFISPNINKLPINLPKVGTGTLADDTAKVGLGFKEDFDLRSSTEELCFMGAISESDKTSNGPVTSSYSL